MTKFNFAAALLAWAAQHGRKNLPWQLEPTPYRVWVSEIMLQQTQVATVIPYYQKFMRSFPQLADLAQAEADAVLHHWSGLGYYARARNLHRAAQIVLQQHDGELPQDIDGLMALPGIGRSTAGAILSLALKQPQPILDGNVKRVLARFFAVEGWPGQTAVQKRLWDYAEQLTPKQQTHRYNQAIMDLGSMICTRSSPKCEQCPMVSQCRAYELQRQQDFPTRKPARNKPVKDTVMLLIRNSAGQLYLQKRPPSGIWGGLWSFPEIAHAHHAGDWCRETLGMDVDILEYLGARRHTFSHFHLDITPVVCQTVDIHFVCDSDAVWFALNQQTGNQQAGLGLAAPVEKLIEEVSKLAQGENREPNGALHKTQ
ncbi:MAG: A/G-specific adenine glycosylase [Chromatiales bacterium]